MKKGIRESLGVNQHDMAMLLGISRSRYSMYELGKRDLPLAATQLLAELLVHAQAPKLQAKAAPQKDKSARKQLLGRLLRENEYQRLLVARKIAAINKKQETVAKLYQLVGFLDSRSAKGKKVDVARQAITQKANPTLAENKSTDLFKLELRQELLELEKQLLESKLNS